MQNMSACNVNMESHHSVWKGPQEMIQLPSHLVRYIKKNNFAGQLLQSVLQTCLKQTDAGSASSLSTDAQAEAA